MNIFILVKKEIINRKEMINRGLSQVDFYYDRLLWAPKSVSPKNIVSFRKLMKTLLQPAIWHFTLLLTFSTLIIFLLVILFSLFYNSYCIFGKNTSVFFLLLFLFWDIVLNEGE